jgi:hypothetical protein
MRSCEAASASRTEQQRAGPIPSLLPGIGSSGDLEALDLMAGND